MESLFWAASSGNREALRSIILDPTPANPDAGSRADSNDYPNRILQLVASDLVGYAGYRISSIGGTNITPFEATLHVQLQSMSETTLPPEAWQDSARLPMQFRNGGWQLVMTRSIHENYRRRIDETARTEWQ